MPFIILHSYSIYIRKNAKVNKNNKNYLNNEEILLPRETFFFLNIGIIFHVPTCLRSTFLCLIPGQDR